MLACLRNLALSFSLVFPASAAYVHTLDYPGSDLAGNIQAFTFITDASCWRLPASDL